METPWFSIWYTAPSTPDLREAEDAEHHESQVADRGVGDQLLDVRLHHRDQRAIDDADDGQRR